MTSVAFTTAVTASAFSSPIFSALPSERWRLGLLLHHNTGMKPHIDLLRRAPRSARLAAAGLPSTMKRLGKIGRDRMFSYRSVWSVLSASSVLSVASAASLLSIGSFASILSIGSSNSVLSIGSDGGFLSIGRRRPR